jgi:hypothetical protein
MNQAPDIVTEHHQQRFVDLCNAGLAAQRVNDNPLDHRESGLDVRAAASGAAGIELGLAATAAFGVAG